MATIEDRLAEFTSDRLPDDGAPLASGCAKHFELLCRDHRGTYTIPFPCHRVADVWRNSWTDEIIDADVVGWRPWQRETPSAT